MAQRPSFHQGMRLGTDTEPTTPDPQPLPSDTSCRLRPSIVSCNRRVDGAGASAAMTDNHWAEEKKIFALGIKSASWRR